jgi:DNA adenine methylase
MPRDACSEAASARPFLKWAGGKGQLLPSILAVLPRRMDTYHEPFLGGGAVFFALANQRRFRHAVLADRNPALIEIYEQVRDHVETLVAVLEQHAPQATSADYFYRLRGLDPSRLSSVERAARLIFLNKTCFNGLYRVNSKGIFNVPFGRHANPKVCNQSVLRAASAALAGVDLRVADFEQVVAAAGPGDAVYFDPPYVPLSATSSFTAYDAFPFGEQEHARLAAVYRRCCDRGILAVLSNSDCRLTRRLYAGLDVRTVWAARAVNSVASKRQPVSEILVVGPAEESMKA